MNPAVIASLSNDEIELAVFDYVTDVLNVASDDWTHAFAALSPGFRAIYATWVLEGEVSNGGFSQFFFNSSGVLAYDARDGLVLIGARRTAAIMEEVIALEKERGTPGSWFHDSATYQSDYDDDYQYADYEKFDDRFFRSGEDLRVLRIRYIRTHPEEFVGPRIS